MSSPAPGTLTLYDDVEPPLQAGAYRATATTTVSVRGADQSLQSQRYFQVESPRFALPPSEIVACYPPRNGHGAFHLSVPHIVLRRRTLPWERALDRGGRIPAPAHAPNEQAPRGRTPWMALLLLDDGEGQLLQNVALEEVVPADVFQRLGAPSGVRCDALEIERPLLASLLPSLEEVRLLAHAREVSSDGRALDAGDGFYAVVMANRLPQVGARHRVCLVSLEERSDLVAANPPAVASDGIVNVSIASAGLLAVAVAPPTGIRTRDLRGFHIPIRPLGAARLVVLTSWTFEGGDASFPDLMRGLDVGLFGLPADGGGPPLADTGHLPMTLEDRAGVTQTVWYRSPLVPQEVARDTAGPYHAADQARRVSPETGAEDITYAAAFEVGRLLCAADARAVADLARWRRLGHREATRGRTLDQAAARLSMDAALAADLPTAPAPVLAVAALQRTATAAVPRADVSGLSGVKVAGLDAAAVADAWALATPAASAVLAPRPITAAVATTLTGAPTAAPPPAVTSAADVESAVTEGLDRLVEAHDARLAPAPRRRP
ncbi:MAG TPA: hypothetical protein VN962_17435 [Polyangia bacterium]|nr:hypothetical protein [Polyangia bacterium]